MKNQIGIVFSGGGVRGMAHIGLLKALSENGIYPEVIAGSSAGALVGALYAAGYEADQMLSFFKTTPVFKFAFYSANKPGLMDSERYHVFFARYFPDDSFAALKKKLFIMATDLEEANTKCFSNGELIKPLLASAAVPPIFTPVTINGKLYADGGIMNNFPVEPLLGNCGVLLGSFVNPVQPLNPIYFSSSMRVLSRSTDLCFYANSMAKFPQCDYLFQPLELANFSLLDTKFIDQVFEIGYQHALHEMDKIMAVIESKEIKGAFLRQQMAKQFSEN